MDFHFQGTTSDAPGWLTAKVDQRIAELAPVIAAQQQNTPSMVMTPLTEPPEDTQESYDRWDRSCDNCGAYCPDDVKFYSGSYSRLVGGVQVMVSFGVCDNCSHGKAD
jgi:hypothetical protein